MASRAATTRAQSTGQPSHHAMATLIEQEARSAVSRAATVTADDVVFHQVLGLERHGEVPLVVGVEAGKTWADLEPVPLDASQ